MNVKVSTLVRRAVMLLDEDMEELDVAQTFGDPGMELRRLASELVEEAVTKTLLEADVDSIDESKTLDASRSLIGSDGSLDVELPEDWLRPVQISMSGWKNVLHDYRTPQPVTRSLMLPGAQLRHKDGRRVLHVSAASGNLTVEYLPHPDASGTSVWIPGSLVNKAARNLADMVKAVITD